MRQRLREAGRWGSNSSDESLSRRQRICSGRAIQGLPPWSRSSLLAVCISLLQYFYDHHRSPRERDRRCSPAILSSFIYLTLVFDQSRGKLNPEGERRGSISFDTYALKLLLTSCSVSSFCDRPSVSTGEGISTVFTSLPCFAQATTVVSRLS